MSETDERNRKVLTSLCFRSAEGEMIWWYSAAMDERGIAILAGLDEFASVTIVQNGQSRTKTKEECPMVSEPLTPQEQREHNARAHKYIYGHREP